MLSQCEATAAEAEALLRAGGTVDATRFAALASYDLWQLSLPPLPTDLHERASTVHQRQLRLQVELTAAMTGIAQQIAFARELQSSGSDLPRYLDLSV